MLDEWFGDDHSPVRPVLTRGDLRQIHRDGYHYNPAAVLGDDTEEIELRLELERLGSCGISVPDRLRDAVVRRARRVRGAAALKLAVAIYSLGLSEPERIVRCLRTLGLELSVGRLFHYAYRYGLRKVRREITFEGVVSSSPEALRLPAPLLERVRPLWAKHFEAMMEDPELMGRRPSTVARLALRRALSEIGL
ncbi:MAG: hypothetical protein ACP5GH_06820 [Nitrososphaeria archaeon]